MLASDYLSRQLLLKWPPAKYLTDSLLLNFSDKQGMRAITVA